MFLKVYLSLLKIEDKTIINPSFIILFLKIEKLSQHLQITIFVSPILNIQSHYFIAEIQLTRVLNCKNSYSSSEF